MADLNDLREGDGVKIRQQLLAMSDEELLEIIRGKRTLRNAPASTTRKAQPKRVGASKKTAVPKARIDDLAAQARSLSPDGAAALLEMLGGNKNGN